MNAWARELRQAGAEGSMDELRATADLDLLLNCLSRPSPGSPPGSSNGKKCGQMSPAGRAARTQAGRVGRHADQNEIGAGRVAA